MIISNPNLRYLFANWVFNFQDAYKAAQGEVYHKQLTTEIPSTSEFNVYPFTGRVPRLSEWVGERKASSFAPYSVTVQNRKFSDLLVVSRTKLADDQYHIYNNMIVDLARAATKWPDTVLFDANGPMRNGQNVASFDGVNFFSTTHPYAYYAGQGPVSTQSNYFTSTALTPDNYNTVRSAMRAFVGEDGLPLGVKPDTLIVPPQLEMIANLIVGSQNIATAGLVGQSMVGANSNPFAGTAKVVVVDDLAVDATTWYLADTSKSIKPWIYQNREAPILEHTTDPMSFDALYKDEYVFSVRTRGNVAPTLWWLCSKCVA